MTIEQLAEKNPCVRFVIDNYDMLCRAHHGKVVMVLNSAIDGIYPDAFVAKTFDTLEDAMIYINAIDIKDVPYVLKECNGGDPKNRLVYSNACIEV